MSSNQGKTELNISTHQQKDKDKSGDYAMHNIGDDKNKDKHEKTSITFERKKQCDDKSCQDKDHQHSWNKDKDLNKDKEFHYESKDLNKDNKDWNKDLNKDKDFNKDKDMHDKSDNKGGIINTIKEKVKDVLGSGDNDKIKDKELHKKTDEKFVGVAGGSSGSSGAQYHSSDLGSSNLGSSNLGSSGVSSGSAGMSSGSTGMSSGSAGMGSSNLGSSNLGSSNLSHEKQFGTTGTSGTSAGYSGATYSGAGQATVDHKNLGAEHREVGYDKHSNVIPSKEKDKDSVHKVDVHGSLYTSGAGSTFKTNEAK